MSHDPRPGFPRLVSQKETVLSPWVTVMERAVQLREDAGVEVYHSVLQAPYVAVLAITRDGRIPLVKQYRPAVDAFTWEFPAGTVDAGESAAEAATRELREEAGLRTRELHQIGAYYPDTGRLSMGSTGFFARCDNAIPAVSPEEGLEIRGVTLAELVAMVTAGDFRHQMHIALIGSALLHGYLVLPRYDEEVHPGHSQTRP